MKSHFGVTQVKHGRELWSFMMAKSILSAQGEIAQGRDKPLTISVRVHLYSRSACFRSNNHPAPCPLYPSHQTTLANVHVLPFFLIALDQNIDCVCRKNVCFLTKESMTPYTLSSWRGLPYFTASVLLGIGYFTYKINTEYKKMWWLTFTVKNVKLHFDLYLH